MTKEKMYSLALRRRLNDNDFFWNHDDFKFCECKIDCGDRYWLADPFVFEKDGVTYLFYEAYDLIQRRGKIGYSIFRENGKKSKINIIIDEPHHLSFPYIFEKNGEIYIMPETCEAFNIKLYKATSFPNKWESHKVIVDDIFTCDTIIAKDSNDNSFLLTSEMYRKDVPVDNYASCWVKNILYPLNPQLNVCGEGTLVAEGDYGIRNAGQFVYSNGKTYRVGQNCLRRQYGKGLVLFEVESFVPYAEKEVMSKDCNDFTAHIIRKTENDIIGIHTYNCSEHYEIIDFSEIKELQISTRLKRKLKEYYLRIRNFIRRTIVKVQEILRFPS